MYLEEVLDPLWVIAGALSTDSLYLLHLPSLTSSLQHTHNSHSQ